MSPRGTDGLSRAMAGLNPQQRTAVEHSGAPLLILAGAGSGKTRVISLKIAHLLERGGMEPGAILAVTFTNKAAEEMRARTVALSRAAEGVMIRTFHSFGAWLLRRNSAVVGLDSRFRVCDDDDAAALLGRVVDAAPTGAPEAVRREWSVAELRGVAARIARAKDRCAGPSDLAEPEAVRWLYEQYDLRLRASGAADFGDLIMLPVMALRRSAELRERLRSRFRAILVDEYQDSNGAQFELLQELWGEGCYLCVVGDDDQSIYKFRGAVVENILTFPEVFPGTTVLRLERNYRSSQSILDVASAVVSRNRGRLGKQLIADREGGESVTCRMFEDQDAEARFVAELALDGFPGSTAVLYRTNSQSRPFEVELASRGVHYRVVGSVRYFDRAEVRDAIAYLALLVNPRDELAWSRVVNHPTRGVGKKSQERILGARGACSGDLLTASRLLLPKLPRGARTGLEAFLALIEEGRSRLEAEGLAAVVEHVIEASGLLAYYREMEPADSAGGSSRVDNLRELVDMAAGREAGPDGLCALLEEAALDSGAEKGDDRGVTLITLHNTKGLEFDRVVITGLEDGIFPLVREGETDVEEERRLFYVGITRARQRLHLTSCRRRRLWGREVEQPPSRFIAEIPPELLVEEGSRPPSAPDGAGRDLGAGPAPEEDGFPVGCAVYHESYGRGTVVERPTDHESEESVAVVRFGTGKTVRFVLRFSSLERVAPDDP